MGNMLPEGSSVPSAVPKSISYGGKTFDITDILADSSLSPGKKRRAILIRTGQRKPRTKYGSEEERKAAAKKRAEARKKKHKGFFSGIGLEPQKKLKLSPEEKKEKRKVKSQARRDFIRKAALEMPDVAKSFGIDPSRIKKIPGL